MVEEQLFRHRGIDRSVPTRCKITAFWTLILGTDVQLTAILRDIAHNRCLNWELKLERIHLRVLERFRRDQVLFSLVGT